MFSGTLRPLAVALCAGLTVAVDAQVLPATDTQFYSVSRSSQWQDWAFPEGTLDISITGSVTPVEFRGPHNAAADAPNFTHAMTGGKEQRGGVWKVGSGEASARRIIDNDPNTYWQPDPDAPLEDWWIEIDLGRATLVSEIRLRFPDTEGARPFREFRVFGSEGRRVTRTDVFSFHLIGGTTRPIQDTLVVYDVEPLVREVRRIDLPQAEATREGSGDETYDLLQYIRILVDAKSPDAALAEVEVMTPGHNIAAQTLSRGGTIVERAGRGFALNMADGDANTEWGARRERGQEQIAWDWDLGARFWIDRIVLRTSDFLQRTLTYGSNLPQIRTHTISVSDGSRTLTGAIAYKQLFEGDEDALLAAASDFPGQVTYRFPPQPVRWVAAEWIGGGTSSSFVAQSGFLIETQIFPVGHMARVVMESDFINLAEFSGDGRAKVIQSLDWDADLPPGAYIQARTRSGNELKETLQYFRKDGTEVTKEQFDQMAVVLRGQTLSRIGVGDDWSGWSNFYQEAGEAFRSPSPRRFAQIQLILGSDRPETAPTVRSVSLAFSDALLAGVHGQIHPQTAEPGALVTITYRIVPTLENRDLGFNRVLVRTPSPARSEDLVLQIDGSPAEPAAVQVGQDSLFVELPRTVRSEEVELTFSTVFSKNPTLLRAFVSNDRQPGIWQPVDPLERASTTVFLPSVPGSSDLIANLSIPRAFTPNGDGVGDDAEIRLNVVKISTAPEVAVFSLDGRRVRVLNGEVQTDRSYLFRWSGTDETGELVPPGLYLCRFLVDAQSADESVHRVIAVIY